VLPEKRQNLLFSATFSDEIQALAGKLLDNPAMIEVARRNTTAEKSSTRRSTAWIARRSASCWPT
jgi:superfamily II DNA/RNA helicase